MAGSWCFVLAAIITTGGGMTVFVPSPQFADVGEFFDGVADDRTKVTWAHAVNSKALLAAALHDDGVMMLEADVSLGRVDESATEQPIMAHPPSTTSDLTLRLFLETVSSEVASGARKGVKLDFKSTEVFLRAVEVLNSTEMRKPFPLWLNADVVAGPVNAGFPPVEATQFLSVCSTRFPSAGVSAGWTTTAAPDAESCYTAEQLAAMVNVLKNAGLGSSTAVTLAARAIYAGRCPDKLVSLLGRDLSHATITLWNAEGDAVNTTGLRHLLQQVGRSRVYLDLPDSMRNEVLNTTAKSASSTLNSLLLLIFLSAVVTMFRAKL